MADDQHIAVGVHLQQILCKVDGNNASTSVAKQNPMAADTADMQNLVSVKV
jgi:hypothetical protein